MHIDAITNGGNANRGLAGIVSLMFLVSAFSGCAGVASRGGEDSRAGSEETSQTASGQEEASVPAKQFEEPGELDKMLDAKPIALAVVKPASQGSQAGAGASPKVSEQPAKGKGNFRIQVGAESDVDAAQAKKQEYEKLLGGTVDVVFDAPYYKLRWGFFDSKQDAEDKILELSDHKIQGFVVKQ
jgi:hypothetical protein